VIVAGNALAHTDGEFTLTVGLALTVTEPVAALPALPLSQLLLSVTVTL
jgi:hypothetical protein